MQILFLSHYFPPEVNAPASRTYEHCKRWVAAGHEVTVITCAPNCPDGVVYEGYKNRFKQEETVDGIRVIRVWTYIAPNKGFFKRILNYVSFMLSAFFYAVLLVKKVDVMVATSPQFFCGWAGVLCHWFKRWPFVLEIRDIWPESILAVGAMKKSVVIRALEFLEKVMYRSASHIIAVGEGYRQRIIGKGIQPEKISVVMNGVDATLFKPIKDITHIKRKFGAEDKFVCSYFGTVGMAHGLEVILKAAKVYKEKNDHRILFWIVGDGARKTELETEAKWLGLNNVVFTGRLPKDRIPEMISASDACLVHLQGTEFFGNVIPSKIFEFMAMNVPIIMGVKGQAREFIIEADAGISMVPDDPTSLMACIEHISNNGEKSFSGRKYVTENFNRDELAEKMLGGLRTQAAIRRK